MRRRHLQYWSPAGVILMCYLYALVRLESFHTTTTPPTQARFLDGFRNVTSTRNRNPQNHSVPLLSLTNRQHTQVTGNVSWLLEIVIAGFGKAGTTTLLRTLQHHPQVACLDNEAWSLVYQQPAQLVSRLYRNLPAHQRHCYKCPRDILEDHVLEYYRTLFPNTKLILGLRNNVEAFESLYNFRIQSLRPAAIRATLALRRNETLLSDDAIPMPHPNDLIGRCRAKTYHTCTELGNYARVLMRLGKQNQGDDGASLKTTPSHDNDESATSMQKLEHTILTYRGGMRGWFNISAVTPLPNPVFVYEVHQLSDTNWSSGFRRDLQHYLGLSEPMPALQHYRPGRDWNNSDLQAQKNSLKIRICDDEFLTVRTELLRLARHNSI